MGKWEPAETQKVRATAEIQKNIFTVLITVLVQMGQIYSMYCYKFIQ